MTVNLITEQAKVHFKNEQTGVDEIYAITHVLLNRH